MYLYLCLPISVLHSIAQPAINVGHEYDGQKEIHFPGASGHRGTRIQAAKQEAESYAFRLLFPV